MPQDPPTVPLPIYLFLILETAAHATHVTLMQAWRDTCADSIAIPNMKNCPLRDYDLKALTNYYTQVPSIRVGNLDHQQVQLMWKLSSSFTLLHTCTYLGVLGAGTYTHKLTLIVTHFHIITLLFQWVTYNAYLFLVLITFI